MGRKKKDKTTAAPGPSQPGPGHNKPELTEEDRKYLFRERYSTIRSIKEQLTGAKATVSTLVGKLRVQYQILEKECGYNRKDVEALEAAIRDPDEMKKAAERQAKLMAWYGLPTGIQASFEFVDRTPAADKAYLEGEGVGMDGTTCNPPYDPSTEQYRRFMEGFHHGNEVRLRNGIKPLSDVPQGSQPAATAAEATATMTHGDDLSDEALTEAAATGGVPRDQWKQGMRDEIVEGDAHIKKTAAELGASTRIGTAESTAVVV